MAKYIQIIDCPSYDSYRDFYRDPRYSLKKLEDGPGSNKTVETKIREKVREKTREKILRLIRENPEITTAEIAEQSRVTSKAIEWNIKKLKKEGIIKRIGPDKGGHWEI